MPSLFESAFIFARDHPLQLARATRRGSATIGSSSAERCNGERSATASSWRFNPSDDPAAKPASAPVQATKPAPAPATPAAKPIAPSGGQTPPPKPKLYGSGTKVSANTTMKSIPIAGGLSLYDWCNGFISGGETIAKLLSDRVNAYSGARREAGKLRSSTVSILGRFRAALTDEMAVNKALPADLDARVFGYFDELHGMRADALAAAHRAQAAQTTPAPKQNPG